MRVVVDDYRQRFKLALASESTDTLNSDQFRFDSCLSHLGRLYLSNCLGALRK